MPGHIERADAAYSLYIRLRASDGSVHVECVTCGVKGHYTGFDCGHGIPRGNMSVRFDGRNTYPQCRVCNRIKGGEPEKFAAAVDRIHGYGTWETLQRLGRSVCKRTKAEIDDMARSYRQEVARLKKEKGI